MEIKTWVERCNDHPDHQTGMISHSMIQARMQEEIEDLRDEVDRLRKGLRQGFPIRYETAAGCLCPAGANASCQNSFCPRRNPPGVTCGGGRS